MPLLLLLFLLCAPVLVAGEPGGQAGERAVYSLRWSFVSVGTVTMTLEEKEEAVLEAVLDAEANAFMRRVHDFHTVITSRFPADAGRSLGYERDEEATGNLHETIFDWEAGTVRYSKNGDRRVPLSLEPGTQDPFSIVHAFRRGVVSLEPGEVRVPVSDGKEIVEARFEISKPQRISTPAGTFRVRRVTADFGPVRAIFARPEGALIDVWLTDDDRRLPVQLRSEATIGSFKAVLTEVDF